jgi:uncharacterized protein YndB with AHSA1/START domain
MDQQVANPTNVERLSGTEFAVTRLFDAPPRVVFKAWSDPKLFQRWWMPKSVAGVSLVACYMDVRTGGKYRLEFGMGDQTMAFFGKYLDVVPDQRIVWTNDEGEEGAVTTVTFEDQGGKTLVRFHEAYPTAEALEEALAGSAKRLPEQFDQLAELLAAAAS